MAHRTSDPFLLLAFAALVASLAPAVGKAQTSGTLAAEIRTAVTTPPTARPLPLSASFLVGEPNKTGYATPEFQFGPEGWLARGYHFLPTFLMPSPDPAPGIGAPSVPDSYYQAAIGEAQRLGMPLVFYGTQWDLLLRNQPEVDAHGDRLWAMIGDKPTLLPGTSREAEWFAVGRRWSSSAQMKRLMALYPNPPKVVFISNNEQKRLEWVHVEHDLRVLDRDPACKAIVIAAGPRLGDNGPGRHCMRRAFSNEWKRLYGKMLDGFRDGLKGTTWERAAQLVGYDAFGPLDIGRSFSWNDGPMTVIGTNGRIETYDPWSETWDGGIVSLYTHNWADFLNDFTLASPQAESMNLVEQIDRARARKPDFWFEAGIWDGWAPDKWFYGDKRKLLALNKQLPTPERYGGWIRFVMWMTRAQVVREYQDYNRTNNETAGHFKALAEAVEQVWRDPTLAAFWREGELVENNAVMHPYRKFHQPDGYPQLRRNFYLSTPSHPAYEANPWNAQHPQESGYAYIVPVVAMGLKRGADYLVYAHSPMGPQKNVTIELPGVFSIKVDVTVAGRFFVVRNGAVARAIDPVRKLGDLVFSSIVYDERLSPGTVGVAWGAKGKVDKIVWTQGYTPGVVENTAIEMPVLFSNDSQTNFVIPKMKVPYTFGGMVRAYRAGELVGEGWLTLGMASPILSTSAAGSPAGFIGTVKAGVVKQTAIGATPGATPVRLAPGTQTATFLVLYSLGTTRMGWKMNTSEANVPAEVCYGNDAPTRVLIGDWAAPTVAPNYIGTVGPGYEQINLFLTDSAGNALPGVPRGANLPIRIEHTDCQKAVHTSNVGRITITD